MEFKAFKYTDIKDIQPCVDYDSPIKMIFDKISEQTNKKMEELDNVVFDEIVKTGITIDKDKLVSILQNDQQRYRDAYTKGYLDALTKFQNAFNRAFAELSGDCDYDLEED